MLDNVQFYIEQQQQEGVEAEGEEEEENDIPEEKPKGGGGGASIAGQDTPSACSRWGSYSESPEGTKCLGTYFTKRLL